jgi:nitric oxide reductase NorQ protein
MAKSMRTPMPSQFRTRIHGGNPDDRPAAPAAPKGRLGNGQLRRQVAEYLTDHPGPCKTGEIAKALARSAGAVGNALTTLADRGEADLVPGKPVRYQANSATAAAAAAIAPKAPLPPKPAAPAAPAPAPSPAATPAVTPSRLRPAR